MASSCGKRFRSTLFVSCFSIVLLCTIFQFKYISEIRIREKKHVVRGKNNSGKNLSNNVEIEIPANDTFSKAASQVHIPKVPPPQFLVSSTKLNNVKMEFSTQRMTFPALFNGITTELPPNEVTLSSAGTDPLSQETYSRVQLSAKGNFLKRESSTAKQQISSASLLHSSPVVGTSSSAKSTVNVLSINSPMMKNKLQRKSSIDATTETVVADIRRLSTSSSTESLKHGAETNENNIEKSIDRNIQRFLVNTENCKIPDLDPYDPVLKDVLNEGEYIACRKTPFTYQDGDMIYINWTAVNTSSVRGQIDWCIYWPIVRPVDETTDHNSLQFLDPSEKFVDKIKVSQHEYTRVKCFNKTEHEIYTNFHSFAAEKRDVEERCERNWKKRRSNGQAPDEDLNVIIVGLDSVSRLNSIRFFKKTRKFLLKNLNAVELLGQNIVGDATFENIVPFLSGKYPKELPWTEEDATTFDDFPFVWDNFSLNGYRTIFLEDRPHGAIFDYLKPGFHKAPTDYYDRHFHLASVNRYYKNDHCLYDKTGTALILNHAERIVSKLRDKPFFSFVFLTRQTHDFLEKTAAVDETHLNFLQNLEKNNVLNNTILFYLSDHGMRFGNIRKFYIGKLEERLPMTFLRVPDWFSEKYPDVIKHLKHNARRLTTKFDLHETLLDILYFKRKRKISTHRRGYSVFRKMPEERSCSDASIEAHWCTCSEFKNIDVNNMSIRMAADHLVLEINSRLQSFSHLCHTYQLSNVTFAYEITANSDDLNKSLKSYQITVVVHPGGAIFEATVMIQESGAITLLGDISRINSYRHQDRCGVGKYLEKLCYCVSNN